MFRAMLAYWMLLAIFNPCWAHPKSEVVVEPNTAATNQSVQQNPKVLKDVRYSPKIAQCVGDIYIPAKTFGSLPAVIVLHGGAWKSGTKNDFNSLEASQWLVNSNFVVFNINYRLTADGGEFPNDVRDVKEAAKFLEHNSRKYSVDKSRIGVFGVSAGGHLALMAGFAPNARFKLQSPNCIKAVAAFCPITDMTQFESSMVVQYLGCCLEQNKSRFAMASPITYAASSIPTLLVHGDKDRLVPIAQSIALAEALKQHQADVRFVRLKNEDHFFSMKNSNDRLVALGELVQFFKDKLANNVTAKAY